MSQAIENLVAAQQFALSIRPKVGGFPDLAETLRLAGIIRNVWFLPSCQSIYLSHESSVVAQGNPLFTGHADIPPFNRHALVLALRLNQSGENTFPEFLQAAWAAGVIRYEVDLENRKVTYYGVREESYCEDYPAVEVQPA